MTRLHLALPLSVVLLFVPDALRAQDGGAGAEGEATPAVRLKFPASMEGPVRLVLSGGGVKTKRTVTSVTKRVKAWPSEAAEEKAPASGGDDRPEGDGE